MDAAVSGHARGWRAVRVGAVLTLVGTCLAACGTGNTAGATTPPVPTPTHAAAPAGPAQPSGPPTATIKNNLITPSTLAVSTGATIEIVNKDSVAHNLEDKVHRLYNGDVPAKGKEELTAPANPGTYDFFDPRHPTAKLTLRVS